METQPIEIFTVLFLKNVFSDQWQHEKIKCRSLSYAREIAKDISRNPKVRDVSIFKGMERIPAKA